MPHLLFILVENIIYILLSSIQWLSLAYILNVNSCLYFKIFYKVNLACKPYAVLSPTSFHPLCPFWDN